MFVGFVALSDNNNYESVQRAFSQVVLQLRHLVNVWRNILPAHVYAKSLGMQANIVSLSMLCCSTFVHLIVSMNMWWRASDQEVDQKVHGKRLCTKIAKHVI